MTSFYNLKLLFIGIMGKKKQLTQEQKQDIGRQILAKEKQDSLARFQNIEQKTFLKNQQLKKKKAIANKKILQTIQNKSLNQRAIHKCLFAVNYQQKFNQLLQKWGSFTKAAYYIGFQQLTNYAQIFKQDKLKLSCKIKKYIIQNRQFPQFQRFNKLTQNDDPLLFYQFLFDQNLKVQQRRVTLQQEDLKILKNLRQYKKKCKKMQNENEKQITQQIPRKKRYSAIKKKMYQNGEINLSDFSQQSMQIEKIDKNQDQQKQKQQQSQSQLGQKLIPHSYPIKKIAKISKKHKKNIALCMNRRRMKEAQIKQGWQREDTNQYHQYLKNTPRIHTVQEYNKMRAQFKNKRRTKVLPFLRKSYLKFKKLNGLKCAFCFLTFKPKTITNHYMRNHLQQVQKRLMSQYFAQNYVCAWCLKKFRSQVGLKNHQNQCQKYQKAKKIFEKKNYYEQDYKNDIQNQILLAYPYLSKQQRQSLFQSKLQQFLTPVSQKQVNQHFLPRQKNKKLLKMIITN